MARLPLIPRALLIAVCCCVFTTLAMAEDAVDAVPALAPEAETAESALAPEAVEDVPPEAPRQGLAWVADVAALLGENPAARDEAEARLIQGGATAVTALAPALQRGDPSQHARLQRTLELIAAHAGAPGADPALAPGVAEALLQVVANLSRVPSVPELVLPHPGTGLAGLLSAAAQWTAQGEQVVANQAGAAQVQARQRALLNVAGTVAGDSHLPALEALAAQAPLAEAVCAVIGRFPGAAADAALERLVTHPQPPVRRMAAACLAERGVVSAIPVLRQRAAEKPGEAAALESAVASLGGAPAGLSNKLDGVDPAMLTRWITLGLRAGQALAARGDAESAAKLLERCIVNAVSWEQVRSGLLLLSGSAPVEAGRLALAYLANAEVRDTALDVLMRVPGTGIDERLAQAYKRAEPVTQAAILEILAARGATQAQTLAAAATQSNSPELRSVAAEVTGTGAAAEDLLAVAALGSAWRRSAALRAFLDQAHALAVSGAAPEAAARFRAVLESPFEAGVLGEALEGLGACGIAADLELLEGARERSDLRESAFRGLVSYWAVQEDADAARAALQALARVAPSEDAAAHAVQAMAQLGQGIAELPAQRGWIVNWNVLGPVPWPEGAAPETPLFAEGRGDAAATVEYEGALYGWEARNSEGIPALVDLSALLAAGAQDAVLYACATLRLPQWTPANLLVSAEGQLLVWVNNELVHQTTRTQSFATGNTEVAIRLRPGFNRIVLKLLPGTGPCRFAARLADRRNAPIDLTGQRLPDDGLAGTGLRPPSLQGNAASELP